MLRLLTKAVRAHQLYLPNNPVYKGAIEALRGAFAPIWRQTDELALRFGETDIRWFGVPVLVETSKSSDSLTWTFFKDGLREILLSPGFETEELNKLLEILQRVRKAAPDEDDLLTLLWEADFANLRYHYVDLGAEPVAPFGASPAEERKSPDQVHAAARQAPEESLSGVVNMQDFDATLFFLDDKELNYLREEVEREYSSDLRANVVAILLDIYESQSRAREEIGGLVDNLMLLLLAAGRLKTVAYLLAESQAATRAADVTPEQKALLNRLPESLSAAEPLGQMLQALDESADVPAQAELTALFEQLRAPALGPILSWLPRIASPAVRALVEKAADRLASANTGELVSLIAAKDRVVALESVRRAGSMKATAAVVPIAKLLASSTDVPLRQTGVLALIDIGSAGALQALERSIEDSDRDVRVAAVRALGAKAYRGVFGRLESVVKGKEIRSVDLTEKMAFFEAYGAMCGDGGVTFLDDLLNGKRLFGKREDPEIRACAAMALGRINTKRSRDALQSAAGEKDVVVRNAVSRAIRGGTTGSGGRPSSA